MQTTGVDDVRYLIQLRQYAPQHLQVVDLNGHIDRCHLLFSIAAAGNAQHVDLLIGENGGDVAQQAATIVGLDAHHQRVARRVALSPHRVNDALGSMRL